MKTIVLILIFVFSFFAVSALFSGFTDDNDVHSSQIAVLSSKLKYLQNNQNRYDVVFLGSSRTLRMIDPQAVHSVCGQTVFNFGVPNLTYEEMLFVINQLNDGSETIQKKTIFIEDPFPAQHRFSAVSSDRIRFFSSFKNTIYRIKNAFSYEEPVHKQAYRSAVAIAAYFYDLSAKGALGKFLFPDVSSKNDEVDMEAIGMPFDWGRNHGYISLDDQAIVNKKLQKRHQIYLENIDDFSKKLSIQKEMDVPISKKAKPRAKLIKEFFKKIENKGYKYGLYIPPLPNRIRQDNGIAHELRTLESNTTILNFNNPNEHAIFWDKDVWFDASHLNKMGANKLSRIIGTQICGEKKGG